MRGDKKVGTEQGRVVNRDEQRERAAAAAEARAQSTNSRGQQGSQSKIRQKASYSNAGEEGRVNVANPSAWN